MRDRGIGSEPLLGISPHICVTLIMSVTPGNSSWGAPGRGPTGDGTQDSAPPTSGICSAGSQRPEEGASPRRRCPSGLCAGRSCFC